MSTTIESPITRAQQNADQSNMDRLSINTIRTLAMDAVQAANSGHPGTPMAMAPVAYTLWQEFLASIRRIPCGRIAIASCCLSGTHRCCSIPCFT
jgi:hypothetical protein